jgi:hypothetical protein
MVHRLAACALGLACVLAILFLVVFQARSVDFDKDWLLEDLTCVELQSAYNFQRESLDQIIQSWHQCNAYYECEDCNNEHGALHCALIRKEGEFVQGTVNDLADVFNAKLECR